MQRNKQQPLIEQVLVLSQCSGISITQISLIGTAFWWATFGSSFLKDL